jgi:hypothetical protein
MGRVPHTPPAPNFFDDSRWPLLVLRLPGTLSMSQFEACLAGLEHHLRRGERFALIVDLRRVTLVPLDQRWRQVEWFETQDQLVRDWLIGSANIVTSPLVRLAVSAILYFKRAPVPLTFVADEREAEAWIRSRIEEDQRERKQSAP